MLGSPQTVLACLPSGETVVPCPAGSAPASLNAYLIDVSAQPQLEASLGPIDFAQASSFWLIGFASVLALWSLGIVVRSAKRAFS